MCWAWAHTPNWTTVSSSSATSGVAMTSSTLAAPRSPPRWRRHGGWAGGPGRSDVTGSRSEVDASGLGGDLLDDDADDDDRGGGEQGGDDDLLGGVAVVGLAAQPLDPAPDTRR